MSKASILGITVFAAVGCGLMGGLLFAFSNFVMKSLARQTPESGIRAMQAINVDILNPLFLLVFMGTALASVVLVATGVLRLSQPGAAFLLAGGALYLVGVVGVTAAFNVPMNDRLAGQDPATPEAARYWAVYAAGWTLWNHVRTAASLLASALLILGTRLALLAAK